MENESGLARYIAGESSAENALAIPAEFFAVPYLQLSQALTPAVQRGELGAGHWYIGEGNCNAKELRIDISISGIRARREYHIDGDLSCYTEDAAAQKGIGSPGGACNECSLQVVLGGKRPACSLQFIYPVYIAEWETYASMRLHRSNVPLAKTINFWAYQADKSIPLSVTLSSTKRQWGKVNYYMAAATLNGNAFMEVE